MSGAVVRADALALRAAQRALGDRSWLGPGWAEGPRAFAQRFLDAYGASLATMGASMAVSAAHSAARAGDPLAGPAAHETWGRAALVLTMRALVRELVTSDREVGNLRAVVREGSAAAYAIGRGLALPTVPEGALRGAAPWVSETLEGLVVGAPASEHGARFASAFFRGAQRAMGSLLASTGGVDPALGALVSEAAREVGPAAWASLAPASRRLLIELCLVELAGLLVGPVVGSTSVAEGEGLVRQTFARRACQVLACLERAGAWANVQVVDEKAAQAAQAPRGGRREQEEGTKAMAAIDRTWKDALQNDALEAGWRTAGAQFVKLAREPLVGLLSRHLGPGDESMRARIAAFLETELGTAMLASLLSVGLTVVPGVKGPVAEKLARELRVKAMSGAADALADVVMGPLRQVMMTYTKDLGAIVEASVPPSLVEAAKAEVGVGEGERQAEAVAASVTGGA
ncbi:MAG TPA: hypothetical protein VFS43_32285 [Polyangiaceae bacterium]|nr:hypothetical protein [Polyangiaceae bacterium]